MPASACRRDHAVLDASALLVRTPQRRLPRRREVVVGWLPSRRPRGLLVRRGESSVSGSCRPVSRRRARRVAWCGDPGAPAAPAGRPGCRSEFVTAAATDRIGHVGLRAGRGRRRSRHSRRPRRTTTTGPVRRSRAVLDEMTGADTTVGDASPPRNGHRVRDNPSSHPNRTPRPGAGRRADALLVLAGGEELQSKAGGPRLTLPFNRPPSPHPRRRVGPARTGGTARGGTGSPALRRGRRTQRRS